MNIRKPTDYTTLFAALDAAVAAQLPQMELYCEIGRVVSGRGEKGAAVAASEYLQATYPAAEGFSPRNVRRMRAFYAAYEESPEIMHLAMRLGWTRNVAILEGCGSHKDRHAKLLDGCIPPEALVRVTRHPALAELPFILETPNDDAGYAQEIAWLRAAQN